MDIPFERFELANGLRVVLAHDPSAPVVAVNLWYNVGSRNDRQGRTGCAHLVEHMMFQGSANVRDTMHFSFIEQAGGSVNGTTWLDRTNYYETVPAQYLELALWLESDRMGWLLPGITKEKLDNQRDVVKNERRWMVDGQPYGDWEERILAMMYPPGHPYHHSTIGSMEDLDATTLEDVVDFLRTYYVPNNAVLTVCGEFEPERARALVERYFGEIPSGPPIPPIQGCTTLEPTLGGERRQTVKQDLALARVSVAYRIPAYGEGGFFPAIVASRILAWGKASRFHRTLIRQRRLANDAMSEAFPLTVSAGLLVSSATASPGVALPALEDALLAEIEGLHDVSAAEVERAINLIEASELIQLERVSYRADQLSMQTTLFDDPGRINTELDLIRAVTPAAVRNFAAACLGRENRGVLQYLPRD